MLSHERLIELAGRERSAEEQAELDTHLAEFKKEIQDVCLKYKLDQVAVAALETRVYPLPMRVELDKKAE